MSTPLAGRAGSPGEFRPRPGAAPLARMVSAQTGLEVRLLLRNGEQLLLTLILPVLLLVSFAKVDIVDLGGRRLNFLVPGVFALAVLSTAFTGQAIATGFERRYGVLKRLGATPLPRRGLIAGKIGAVLVIEMGQLALLTAVGLALGWSPHGSFPSFVAAAILLALATAAFTGLALWLAGSLRAEATLALANLAYVLLLLTGGIFVPLSRYPDAAQTVLRFTPLAALAEGLRAVLGDGSSLPAVPVAVLAGWAAGSCAVAAATFRWE